MRRASVVIIPGRVFPSWNSQVQMSMAEKDLGYSGNRKKADVSEFSRTDAKMSLEQFWQMSDNIRPCKQRMLPSQKF